MGGGLKRSVDGTGFGSVPGTDAKIMCFGKQAATLHIRFDTERDEAAR